MTISPRRSRVRPFSEADIPRAVYLHRTAFRIGDFPSEEAYRDFFSELYLYHPALEGGVASLVYEEDDGSVSGFLGIVPVTMSLGRRTVQARVSSAFVVDPQKRGWAGVTLLRTFLNGPQDLSICDEAKSNTHALWQDLGGATSTLFSMHWICPLRPLPLGISLLLQGRPRLASALSRAAKPFTAPLDRLAVHRYRGTPSVRLNEEDLTAGELEALLKRPLKRPLLRPEYDLRSLEWKLNRAARLDRNGSLQKVIVRTESNDVAGWFIYYLNRGGLSQVLQVDAAHPHEEAVLARLADHAYRGGAAGLRGRFEPSIADALARTRYIFHYGRPWTLIHARDPDLLNAFHRGDVFFSRLDGEWCLHLS